jgi:hypothetical protein
MVFKPPGESFMDMSKLPKLSQTPKPPGNEPTQQEPAPIAYEAPANVEAGAGAMLWFSIIIGGLCMLMGRMFGGYLWATIRGKEYQTGFTWSVGQKAGKNVGYWEIEGGIGWTNAGIFLFGVAMIMEGVALGMVSGNRGGKKILLAVSLAAVVLATVVNLFTAVRVFNLGQIPTMSGLAVAFGGYMAIYQWKLLRALSTKRAAPMT